MPDVIPDQFRFTTHAGAVCPACERMVERNARLALAVRRLVAAVHRAEHHGGAHGWVRCQDPVCLSVVALLEGQP
jgi:hypothetical protein